MPFAEFGGVPTYFEIHGAGPAIVFVHGGGGNTLSWFNQIPHFVDRYTSINVDLRTFKHSICPFELYHPKFFADDVLAVLDYLGIKRAAFACQSLGAWAALPLAVRHSERVACLAISSSPTPAYSPSNWALLERAIHSAVDKQRGRPDQFLAQGFNPEFAAKHPERMFLYEALSRLNGKRNSPLMADESCKLYPVEFEHYATPTLIMGGEHDLFLTPQSHHHVASLIPGAEVHTFEHSGHHPYWEEPAEFNRVLDAFLVKNGWLGL